MVSQAYAVNLMEEYVLRGNAAILKCHIPSFVSEYVTVVSWIISEDNEEVEIKLDSTKDLEGTIFNLSGLYPLHQSLVVDVILNRNCSFHGFPLFHRPHGLPFLHSSFLRLRHAMEFISKSQHYVALLNLMNEIHIFYEILDIL